MYRVLFMRFASVTWRQCHVMYRVLFMHLRLVVRVVLLLSAVIAPATTSCHDVQQGLFQCCSACQKGVTVCAVSALDPALGCAC
jgi:hypothetical protein